MSLFNEDEDFDMSLVRAPIRRAKIASPTVMIEAFCMFDCRIIQIEYPTAENNWIYRPELGGHSLHRWDLDGEEACMLAKHSTCSKAMRPRGKLCRNCDMKKTWRRECAESCNIFFIYALSDATSARQAIAHLFNHSFTPSNEEMRLYISFAPKIPTRPKRSAQERSKMERMLQMERNLRHSVTGASRQEDPGAQLLNLLLDADDSSPECETQLLLTAPSADDDTDASASLFESQRPHSADEHTATLASFLEGPFVFRPVSSNSVAATTPDTLAPSPRPAEALQGGTLQNSTSMKCAVAKHTYDAIVDLLIEFDARMSVRISTSVATALVSRFPLGFHGLSKLEDSEFLSHLYAIMGIAHQPFLLMKTSLLQVWVNGLTLCERRVYIGFVSMPTARVYQEMRTMEVLPCIFTENEISIHDTFETAKAQCTAGTDPCMCAYHSPHAKGRVFAEKLLPIAL